MRYCTSVRAVGTQTHTPTLSAKWICDKTRKCYKRKWHIHKEREPFIWSTIEMIKRKDPRNSHVFVRLCVYNYYALFLCFFALFLFFLLIFRIILFSLYLVKFFMCCFSPCFTLFLRFLFLLFFLLLYFNGFPVLLPIFQIHIHIANENSSQENADCKLPADNMNIPNTTVL